VFGCSTEIWGAVLGLILLVICSNELFSLLYPQKSNNESHRRLPNRRTRVVKVGFTHLVLPMVQNWRQNSSLELMSSTLRTRAGHMYTISSVL